VTIEGSVLTGIAEGPKAIRAILGFARTLYDYQEFNYVGPYGDHRFVEDYTSVLLWSQLMGEHFAGTLYALYFLSQDAAETLREAGGVIPVSGDMSMPAG
jgi:hypothetical protein